MNLNGKVAMITGASSGIGYGITKKLSSKGCKVLMVSKTKKKLEKSANEIPNSIPLIADVTSIKHLKKLKKMLRTHTDNIDILVCNVGSGSSAAPGKEKISDWHKMLDINLFSSINVISEFKDLISKKGGSIVCISSICGIDFIPGAPIPYSVSKAALNHYIKTSAREFATENIRINAVAPGNILFQGSTWEKKLIKNKRLVRKMLNENVSLKKFGSIEDVASMVLFLSCENSKFITGSVIPVDGGQLR